MRVHPILDWSYADIWQFLRELDVEYCELYDEGWVSVLRMLQRASETHSVLPAHGRRYTSLGSTRNTHPNPCLRNPERASGWDPAWKLADESLERAGRDDVQKATV